ncbi:MAG: ATP synthase F1 subunit gamma [Clostridiales bacterium]|nr:ATP synthase F1 subunit gamma [Clostridiales bacterium]
MPNLNELKNRAGGVRSTRQVTHAMYLISASKSKRAKLQLDAVQPFFDRVERTIAEILAARGAPAADSPFTERRDSVKRSLCFAVGGDKGMAGGYNHNLIRFMEERIDKAGTDVLMAGFMGRSRAERAGFSLDPEFRFPVMNPNLIRARDIADILIERYLTGKYREAFIICTRMDSAIKQEPMLIPLLPLTPEQFADVSETQVKKYDSIQYEPGPAEVFDSLTPHYVKGIVYAALVEAYTSEQHARMLAMDSATKSADDIISDLSLRYNRARQAMITQEITEIVSGIPTE